MPVELTRRGKPVAVLLTLADYERLSRGPRPFWDVCQEFREEMSIAQLDIQPNFLAGIRDTSPGREVNL
jgi:antitoxin (DNA-binding transcriptional repressor) of toxin-antitoxin stability system